MNKDQIWRDKIRTITSTMGAAGDAVYREIEEAVEDRIEEAQSSAESVGREYGFWQGNSPY